MADQALADAVAEWDSVAAEREGAATPAETPPELTPETIPETTPEAAAAEQKPVDPYEGLHPDVRARLERFDQMAASQQQLVNELKEAKGRIGALQSEFAKARQAKPAEQPSQTQIAAAQKDPEKWTALKQDFPEWGEGITAYVESRLGQLTGVGLTPEQIEQLVAQRTDATTAQLEKKFNEALVGVKHKTWRQDVNSPEFEAWFRVQAPEVQALANSRDGFDAIDMLDRYHADRAKPVAAVKGDRQSKLQAAVTGKPGPAKVTKTFDDMSPAEQWEYMAKERDRSAA
jgi:hypothetical protein